MPGRWQLLRHFIRQGNQLSIRRLPIWYSAPAWPLAESVARFQTNSAG